MVALYDYFLCMVRDFLPFTYEIIETCRMRLDKYDESDKMLRMLRVTRDPSIKRDVNSQFGLLSIYNLDLLSEEMFAFTRLSSILECFP